MFFLIIKMEQHYCIRNYKLIYNNYFLVINNNRYLRQLRRDHVSVEPATDQAPTLQGHRERIWTDERSQTSVSPVVQTRMYSGRPANAAGCTQHPCSPTLSRGKQTNTPKHYCIPISTLLERFEAHRVHNKAKNFTEHTFQKR